MSTRGPTKCTPSRWSRVRWPGNAGRPSACTTRWNGRSRSSQWRSALPTARAASGRPAIMPTSPEVATRPDGMLLTTPYTVRRQTLAGSARIMRILPRRPSRAILDLVSGDALDRFISGQHERFIEELRDICAIPCEASDRAALDAAARWCRDRLRAAGFGHARELRADGAPALVVAETGSGERTLVGVQHYDVQPAVPLDLWKTPPYQPALRDGAMYARGVDDNKGHLLLRIQAIEAHRAAFGELPIKVRFLIEGEEESGSPNLARLLSLEPGLTDADGALKEGGALDSEGRPILSLGGKGI